MAPLLSLLERRRRRGRRKEVSAFAFLNKMERRTKRESLKEDCSGEEAAVAFYVGHIRDRLCGFETKETGKSGLHLHFKYISSRATKSSASSSPLSSYSSYSSSSSSNSYLATRRSFPFGRGTSLLFERAGKRIEFNIAMSRREQAVDIEGKRGGFFRMRFYFLSSFSR